MRSLLLLRVNILLLLLACTSYAADRAIVPAKVVIGGTMRTVFLVFQDGFSIVAGASNYDTLLVEVPESEFADSAYAAFKADSSRKALKDGSGNTIVSTYVKVNAQAVTMTPADSFGISANGDATDLFLEGVSDATTRTKWLRWSGTSADLHGNFTIDNGKYIMRLSSAPAANIVSLLGAADYAAVRSLLGLVIGTNVQAYDADLDDLADGTLNGTKVQRQKSITADGSGLSLDGDESSPGNSQYYGTDGSGTKGFHALTGGSGSTLDAHAFTVGNAISSITLTSDQVLFVWVSASIDLVLDGNGSLGLTFNGETLDSKQVRNPSSTNSWRGTVSLMGYYTGFTGTSDLEVTGLSGDITDLSQGTIMYQIITP